MWRKVRLDQLIILQSYKFLNSIEISKLSLNLLLEVAHFFKLSYINLLETSNGSVGSGVLNTSGFHSESL
jgi:hypothetical protein